MLLSRASLGLEAVWGQGGWEGRLAEQTRRTGPPRAPAHSFHTPTSPSNQQHPHQVPGSTKGSPSPKWLFHFLKLKYGMGEGCPMALSQLLPGWEQGTGPRLAPPPKKPRNRGLKVLPTKVGIPLAPAQEGHPRPPNPSQTLAKQEASLRTYP